MAGIGGKRTLVRDNFPSRTCCFLRTLAEAYTVQQPPAEICDE